jgi:hypothetical protein
MIEEENAASSSEQRDLIQRSDRTNDDAQLNDRVILRGAHVSAEAIGCSVENCSNRGAGTFGHRIFCVHHFTLRCFEGLRDCTVSWCLNEPEEALKSCDAFVRECILETSKVLQGSSDIDRVRRGHLLDVLLWASELATKRRRLISER